MGIYLMTDDRLTPDRDEAVSVGDGLVILVPVVMTRLTHTIHSLT